MEVTIDQRRVRRALALMVIGLAVTTAAAQALKWQGRALGLARFFDSDQKVNFPTGFKVLALAVATVCVWAIARIARADGDPLARHWSFLAVVTALLTLDEIAFVHQSLGHVLHDRYETSGPLRFAWLMIYVPLGLVGVVILWRFLWSISSATRRLLIVAGGLFAVGTGLLNLVKGVIDTNAGSDSLAFLLTAATSDIFEEMGIAVLLLAYLSELASRRRNLIIIVAPVSSTG